MISVNQITYLKEEVHRIINCVEEEHGKLTGSGLELANTLMDFFEIHEDCAKIYNHLEENVSPNEIKKIQNISLDKIKFYTFGGLLFRYDYDKKKLYHVVDKSNNIEMVKETTFFPNAKNGDIIEYSVDEFISSLHTIASCKPDEN